jgi:hypothetical protein
MHSSKEKDQEKELEKAVQSKKHMEESFDLVNQQRFGLFSQPGSLAIGENTYAPKKLAKLDEDGKVLSEPPNFLTTKTKIGHTDDVLFSLPSYVSQGDPYISKKLVMRDSKADGHKAICDLQFRPAKMVPTPVVAEFEYLPQDKNEKKNFRNEEGGVKTAPRNFTTTAAKKGMYILNFRLNSNLKLNYR